MALSWFVAVIMLILKTLFVILIPNPSTMSVIIKIFIRIRNNQNLD